ncbi:MAG: DinB family protein [Gemmatimonadales bacterium]
MAPELSEFLSQLEAVKADGRAVAAGLSEAQFNWRPAPDRWSIGDCLAHLNESVTTTLPAFDAAIAAGRARGLVSPGPYKYGWFASWMARSMEPPPRWRMRSPSVFRTSPAQRRADVVVPEFLAVRDRLAERVRRADGLDLTRVRVTSPASRFFRLPLGAYFGFVLGHERRHVWQARQVRNAPDFGAERGA